MGKSDNEGISALSIAHSIIPRDGRHGTFGYGILTGAGLDGTIIITTYGRIEDSEVQKDRFDPVFHNRYVKLATGLSGRCGNSPEVADLTFESPGRVNVLQKLVAMRICHFHFRHKCFD